MVENWGTYIYFFVFADFHLLPWQAEFDSSQEEPLSGVLFIHYIHSFSKSPPK